MEPEFDALLKSHVQKHGATNTTICDQFDFELAHAYLERALTKNALTAFEAHLLHCPSCRHHMIELSRLMPASVTENILVPASMTLKERLGDWFRGWNLGALAGLGAVASTILFFTLVMRSFTPAPMVASRTDHMAGPQDPPSSTVLHSAENTEAEKAGKPAATVTPAIITDAQGSPNSTPLIAPRSVPTPSGGGTSVATPLSSATESALKTEPEQKEAIANQVGQLGNTTLPNQQRNYRAIVPSGPAANQAPLDRSQQAEAPPPPPVPAAKPVEKTVEKDKREAPLVVADARRDESAVRQSSGAEAQPKSAKSQVPTPAPLAMKKVERERSGLPVRNIGGKVFRLENAIWTDSAYDAGKDLPVVRLQHDSDEYKQTLKDFPGLKPYFDLQPVLVVWQGKVYRVAKK